MKNLLFMLIVLTEIIHSQPILVKRNKDELMSRKEHKLSQRKIQNFKSFDKNKKVDFSSLFTDKTSLSKTENAVGYIYDFIITQWNTETSKWENSEHYTNKYDDQFNELESVYQIWDGSNWANSERYTSEYDENSNWISYLFENWNSNNWIKYILYSTSYNSQNLITEDLVQIWNDVSSKWENYVIFKYDYDNDWNNINYLRQDWNFDSSIWQNIWQHVGQYQNNLLMEDLLQEWSNNNWQNYSLTDYEYDGNQNMVNQLIQVWSGNSTWEKTSDHIFVYDDNNNNTEYYYNVWDDSLSTWITWYRDLYTYDQNNNQTGYLSEDWNNNDSTWINYEQAFFTYDEDGYFESELYQNWDSDLSDWVNSTRIDYVLTEIPTSVKVENLVDNYSFRLAQNYPNPFNPTTIISYSIPLTETQNFESIEISVFDVLGRKIKTLVEGVAKPGNFQVNFDGSKYSSGIYYCVLNIGSKNKIIKMQLLK